MIIKKADVDNYRANKARTRVLPFRIAKSVPDATGFSQPAAKAVEQAIPATGLVTNSTNTFRKL
jgi:hypothetical protein